MKTVFEENSNKSASYSEAISFYTSLAKNKNVQMNAVGRTDSGNPLHEVIVTNDGVFDPAKVRASGKTIILVNNAIHAGEPCGIDASMMLARDLTGKKKGLLDHATIIFIPVYNIGGSLNRGRDSRANQDGPDEHGFRGNARNLDLNRDFIKCDSDNAKSFATIYNKWNPEIFIDNHTSNGSDYQYVMTLIPTQKDKIDPILSSHLSDVMLPELFSAMDKKGYTMTPYVNSMGRTPEAGIAGFNDMARYSSGYAALHHAISFMPETHMLKPFEDRVKSTYLFMESMLEHVEKHYKQINANYKQAIENAKTKKEWAINYTLDREKYDEIDFMGYEAKYKPSLISGKDRLYYDKNAPFTKKVKHFNTYKPTATVTKPDAYVVPQAYKNIVDMLIKNGAKVEQLKEDKKMNVQAYYIEDYTSSPRPYEGHFLHRGVEVRKEKQEWQYFKGDYVIPMDQAANRFIIETLEPQGPDSYFAWNYFDAILGQKEYFSAYVFEDYAHDYLEKHPDLKAKLEAKKAEDEKFAESAYAQLQFIYKNSPYYEPTHLRYPVTRIEK